MARGSLGFSSLVFFGDSLTDATKHPPGLPQVGGLYSEALPLELGITAANFARSGGQALTDAMDTPAQRLLNLDAQVADFLAAIGPAGVPAGTAASLFIGGNDYGAAATPEEAVAAIAGVAASTHHALQALVAAGVRDVVLYTQFNLSSLPYGRLMPAEFNLAADAIFAAHNGALKQIAEMHRAAGIDVTVVDTNRLLVEICADRETFGFMEVDAPQYLPDAAGKLQGSPASTMYHADQIAFFDYTHPSSATHGVVTAFSEATLTADKVDLSGDSGDHVKGSRGHDLIFTGGGADSIRGGRGDDVIFAGTGDDRAFGGAGGDLLSGGSGSDRLEGRRGADLLAGNAGADHLSGGRGRDILLGGGGGDTALGGAGNDVLLFTEDGLGNGNDVIDGGGGLDIARISISADLFASSAFNAQLDTLVSRYKPACGFSSFTFASLELTLRGIERVEVIVDDAVVFAAGRAAPPASVETQAMLHDAGLWGLI